MAEKTEEPTPNKIRDARKEGNVARSKELSEVVTLGTVIFYFIFQGHTIFEEFLNLIATASNCDLNYAKQCVKYIAARVVYESFIIVIPFILIVIMTALLSEFTQIGFIFAPKKLAIDFKKFNVVQNAANLVSLKSLINIFKMIVIAIVAPFIMYFVYVAGLHELIMSMFHGIHAVYTITIELIKKELLYLLLFLFVISCLDYLYQRYAYFKELRMTKDEVKKEFKEDQGDPLIKEKRRSFFREITSGDGGPPQPQASSSGSDSDVDSATAVVTNPSHYAVAIFYDKTKVSLPIVVAKGRDAMAYAMVKRAQKLGIPVIRNVPLARGLMYFAHINRYIPLEFLEATADILKIVRKIRLEDELKRSDKIDFYEEW